jgi:hypothetical protein
VAVLFIGSVAAQQVWQHRSELPPEWRERLARPLGEILGAGAQSTEGRAASLALSNSAAASKPSPDGAAIPTGIKDENAAPLQARSLERTVRNLEVLWGASGLPAQTVAAGGSGGELGGGFGHGIGGSGLTAAVRSAPATANTATASPRKAAVNQPRPPRSGGGSSFVSAPGSGVAAAPEAVAAAVTADPVTASLAAEHTTPPSALGGTQPGTGLGGPSNGVLGGAARSSLAVTPEPGTLLLMVTGLTAAMSEAARRRRGARRPPR